MQALLCPIACGAASGTFVRQAKAQRPKLTRKQRRAKAAAKAKAMLNEEDMFESTRPPATTTSEEEEEGQPPPPANSRLMFISCSGHAYCNSCSKGYVKKDPNKVLEEKDRKCPQCQSRMVFLDDYLNCSHALAHMQALLCPIACGAASGACQLMANAISNVLAL